VAAGGGADLQSEEKERPPLRQHIWHRERGHDIPAREERQGREGTRDEGQGERRGGRDKGGKGLSLT
jgi:hypothetical protein